MLADSSMLVPQPPETRGRRRLHVELAEPAVSLCRQSVDDDGRQTLMSAAGCPQDTPVLCHAHSDMPEHTTETGFAPVRLTSEGPGAVGLCVLTLGENRRVEWRRSAQTAAGFAGSQQYLQGLSCSGPVC